MSVPLRRLETDATEATGRGKETGFLPRPAKRHQRLSGTIVGGAPGRPLPSPKERAHGKARAKAKAKEKAKVKAERVAKEKVRAEKATMANRQAKAQVRAKTLNFAVFKTKSEETFVGAAAFQENIKQLQGLEADDKIPVEDLYLLIAWEWALEQEQKERSASKQVM